LKKEQAIALLQRSGAPTRLLVHVELVGEAGEEIISELERLGAELDKDFIRSGIVLHDIGKTIHLSELDRGGDLHGETGRELLRQEGVEPRLAQVCVSHFAWRQAETVEELVIACSDKLWKGSRVADLEEMLCRRVATDLGLEYWDVFARLDSCFEAIADGADERLARSRFGTVF
jgi:putative nucleotidyltransferase with HDIG domain